MNRLWMLLFCLLAAGCGKDPLSAKVDKLQGQVAELQAERAAQQQALLEQLDQIGVTAENAGTVADIRAKLAQTGVTQSDLVRLQAQITALQQISLDWTAPVAQIKQGVYAVMHGVYPANDKTQMKFAFLGTAFAVDGQTLVTNGHMVDGLLQLNKEITQYNTQNHTNLQTVWIVVQNLSTTFNYKQNYFYIGKYATHPGWNAKDPTSVDVGMMRVQEGTMARQLYLLTPAEALLLKVGQPIGTLGFPGELQGDTMADLAPIATFKTGTISALRPPQQGQPYTAKDTYIVQHNLDLSGGTSGSPIVNPAGKVVAVNSAGIEVRVRTTTGDTARVATADLGFGIRADKIQELLSANPAGKPVAVAVDPDLWRALEGRALKDMDIRDGGGDLEQQLKELTTGSD